MTFSIPPSPSTLMATLRPNPPSPRRPADASPADGGGQGGMSPVVAAGSRSGGRETSAAKSGGGKQVVDQRTTEAGGVRITVISYSDGSSDTLKVLKGGAFGKDNSTTHPTDKILAGAMRGDRGDLVDGLA